MQCFSQKIGEVTSPSTMGYLDGSRARNQVVVAIGRAGAAVSRQALLPIDPVGLRFGSGRWHDRCNLQSNNSIKPEFGESIVGNTTRLGVSAWS
mmetsp:Transcript_8454/g.20789  ORF Transcript_8454/g.20789 Transcript_8454/m.20789 type:complete len:94 (+) Transcript_8454:1995-2276(+)